MHPFYPTVLHRVVMDVVHMPGQIRLILNRVFPIAPLPQVIFTLRIQRMSPTSALTSACVNRLLIDF